MERPITIRDLTKWDIPEAAVEGWIDGFNQRSTNGKPRKDYKLTDLQSFALGHPETLHGTGNLLVTGPTSSGKTLVAEAIVAATLAHDPKAKILYLVPLRVLVTEKWRQFKAVFEVQKIVKEGYIVPLSTDYPSSDHTIAKGEWNVAILVFDKLYRWFADERRLKELVSSVDLVIVDEVQVIEEPERGEKLESIVSILLWLQLNVRHDFKPRLVAMAASDTTENDTIRHLEKWLKATVVPDFHQPVNRPVRLYEGWMIVSQKPGEQELVIYSNPLSREDLSPEEYPQPLHNSFKKLPQAKSRHQLAVTLTVKFISQKLRVLIYVATKGNLREMVMGLQKALLKSGKSSRIHPAIASALDELENSQVKKMLTQTLPVRVGFHHGDMTQAERYLVEEGFRQVGTDPPVSVVVATPTLSMGVNLPADVVLMRDQYTHKKIKDSLSQNGRNGTERRQTEEQPISILTYRNFAGRAGRNRPDLPEDAFGLSLLLTTKEERRVIDELLHGKLKPLVSQLCQPMYGYHPHVLIILAVVSLMRKGGGTITEESVLQILQKSYAWVIDDATKKLKQGVNSAFFDLKKLVLIDKNNNLNGPGKAAASHHLSYGSAEGLLALAEELHDLWPQHPLDLLYRISDLPEVQAEYPRLSDLPPQDSERRQLLEENLRAFFKGRTTPRLYADGPSHPFRIFLQGLTIPTDEELLKLIRTAVTWGWLKGIPSSQLEESHAFPKLYLGPLKRLGDRLSFCISALRCLYLSTLFSEQYMARQLWLFQQALRYGVPPEVVMLPVVVSHASNQQLTRESGMEIWASTGGWVDARKLIGMSSPEKLSLRTWDMVQEGLRWWVEEAKKLQEAPLEVDEKEMNDEFGMMLHALEDSSKGAYTGDFALFAGREPEEHVIGPVPARHTAVELNTGIHDMILERTRQRIARYPVQEYGGLRSLASSALERNPISMKLDLLFPGSRLLVLKMGDAWLATVRLISGKPTKQILKSLPNNFRLIVICEQAPNAEVHLPKKVALLITIDALVAASEFVGDQPRYRPRLLEVLSTQQGSIESVEEMLKLMVLDTASAVERTQI